MIVNQLQKILLVLKSVSFVYRNREITLRRVDGLNCISTVNMEGVHRDFDFENGCNIVSALLVWFGSSVVIWCLMALLVWLVTS
jgi:hypothetical protein